MSSSLNKVQLIGNLGQDPEVRNTQSGGKIVSMSLATSESWNDKHSGERRERTEWHRIVIFNEGLGSVAEQYARKGAKVYVEGQLRTRKWQDQSGTDRYSTEVVLSAYNGTFLLLDKKNGNGDSQRQASTPSTARGWDAPPTGGGDLDDEVPF